MKTQYLLGVIFLIVFCGCNKLQGTDGTYTIKGRFLKDCSGDPLANYGIRLYYIGDPYGFRGGNKDVATDTTDANGYYEFRNVPLKYRSDLLVLHDFKADDVVKWGDVSFGRAKDGDIVTCNFYSRYEMVSNIEINIKTSHTANDTLYIGDSWGSFQTIYPIPNRSFLSFKKSYSTIVLEDSTTFKIYWSIGKKHFDSLVKYPPRPTNWRDYYFETIGKLCFDDVAETINIP